MTAPVVTGIGVAAPNGIGTEEYWAAVLRGESGIRRITRFDPTDYTAALAGELIVDPAGRLPGRLVPQTDHMTQAALVVAEQALADAEVVTEDLPEYSAGVVTSASGGGFEFGQRELEALWHKGGKYVSAYQSFAWFYPVNTGQISIRHDLRGPSGAVVSEQAGGLDAVAKARRNLGVGARLMVAGGVDGSLCPWSWVCQLQSGRVSDRSDPKRAYVPFDAEASGCCPVRAVRCWCWSRRKRPRNGTPGTGTVRSSATRPHSTRDRAPTGRTACAGVSNWPWPTRGSNRPKWTWCSRTRPGYRRPTAGRPRCSPRCSAPGRCR